MRSSGQTVVDVQHGQANGDQHHGQAQAEADDQRQAQTNPLDGDGEQEDRVIVSGQGTIPPLYPAAATIAAIRPYFGIG